MTIKNPLTKDEVRSALAALTADGLPHSLRGILERCGRGSLSTISRFKAEIHAEEAAQAAEAPTIAPALQPIFALDPKLYARLMDAARNEVRKETEELQVRCAALDADQTALVTANAALEDQAALLAGELETTKTALTAETARRETVQVEYHQAAIRWADRMNDIGERLAAIDEMKQHLHAVAIHQSRITVAVEAIPGHVEQISTHAAERVAQLAADLLANQQSTANSQREQLHELQTAAARESTHVQAMITGRLGHIERTINAIRYMLGRAITRMG